MTQFYTFFSEGFNHIVHWSAYDHILFLIVLVVLYHVRDWKNLLILVTSFTIGHSITLAVVSLGILKVDRGLIEFLIPMTILITALINLFKKPVIYTKKFQVNYFIALAFGFIHGMGFAGRLKMLIGKSDEVIVSLFSFNLGVEAGQIIIVSIVLGVSFIFTEFFGILRRDWNLIISSAAGGIAFMILLENKIW